MPVVHKKEDDDIELVISMTNKNRKKVVNERRIQEEQEQIKRKKRNKRRNSIIKWTCIISFIITGFMVAFISPLFNITEIKVENNEILSEKKIISISKLKKGQNILRFLKSDIKTFIKEEPYVENVEIRREFPGTVIIDVKERKRNFCIKFLNEYAYINNQGYILEISEDSLGLPIILGTQTPEADIKPGNRLNKADLKKLEVVIQIMTTAKENEIDSKITTIDISDKNEYILYLAEENKYAYIGNSSNINTKILYIKEILEKEEGKEGTIFVNGDFTNKFKPYFREKV